MNLKRLVLMIFITSMLSIPSLKAQFYPDVVMTSSDGLWTDVRAYTDLNAAITAIGSKVRTLVISKQLTTGTSVIPSNITLKFERDGNINTTTSLDIQTKNIIAPDRLIFSGAGSISFADGSIVRSSWFSSFYVAAVRTASSKVTLVISKQETISNTFAIGNNVNLKFESPESRLTVANGFTVSNIGNIEAGDFQILTSAGTGAYTFKDGVNLNCTWFPSFRTAISFIGATKATLLIHPTTVIDYTQATPSTLTLDFQHFGGTFLVNVGVVLTVNGDIITTSVYPYTSIFTGAGTITFNGNGTDNGLRKDLASTSSGKGDLLVGHKSFSTNSTATTVGAWLDQFFLLSKDAGADPTGTVSANAALTVACAQAKPILVDYGSYLITASMSCSAPLYYMGGMFTSTNSSTLTLTGPQSGSDGQRFGGNLVVSFAGNPYVTKVKPEYWKTNTTPGVTDMVDAINAALVAANTELSETSYLVSKAIRVPSLRSFTGQGWNTFLSRSNITPETISGVAVNTILYLPGVRNNIEGIRIYGDPAYLDGIQFGAATPNNSTFKNISILNTYRGIYAQQSIFMMHFDHVYVGQSEIGFDFYSVYDKTSLTFDSSFCVNCGLSWMFNRTYYSTLNSCGADWQVNGIAGGYGSEFGSKATPYGVYTFVSSNMTVNSSGTESSYGNGSFYVDNAQVVFNAPFSYNGKSTYDPTTSGYADFGVGPFVTGQNPVSLKISSPRLGSWENTYVTAHPTTPVGALVGYNVDYAGSGYSQKVMVNADAINIAGTLFAGHGSIKSQCRVDSGPSLQGGTVARYPAAILAGTGTLIKIPITSQGTRNTKHWIKVVVMDGTYNAVDPKPASVEVAFGSLTSIGNITSFNSSGVASVAASGMDLVITLSTSVATPYVTLEVVSENYDLIGQSGMTCSAP